jgi:hypothetical protein
MNQQCLVYVLIFSTESHSIKWEDNFLSGSGQSQGSIADFAQKD